jgi:hypothetical protein
VVHAPAVEQRTLGAPPAAIVVAREQEESLACADECQDGDGCIYLDRGVMRHLECGTTGATDRSILPRSATELGFLDRGSGADVRGLAPGDDAGDADELARERADRSDARRVRGESIGATAARSAGTADDIAHHQTPRGYDTGPAVKTRTPASRLVALPRRRWLPGLG